MQVSDRIRTSAGSRHAMCSPGSIVLLRTGIAHRARPSTSIVLGTDHRCDDRVRPGGLHSIWGPAFLKHALAMCAGARSRHANCRTACAALEKIAQLFSESRPLGACAVWLCGGTAAPWSMPRTARSSRRPQEDERDRWPGHKLCKAGSSTRSLCV